jgi:glycosyltransferase involved in cell wall biosynthesis
VRILTVGNMYPPHHLGGYELMWRSAVRHLREWGHEVRVLTTDYRAPQAEDLGAEDDEVFRELRWYWQDHEFPRMGPRARVALERHNARVLERHIEASQAEAISWWAMGGMSMSLLEQARRLDLPASCVVVDDWLLYGPKVDAYTRMARLAGPLRPLVERAAGVPGRRDVEHPAEWLFASKTLLRRARNEGGLGLEAAEVAYPGIDHSLFREPRTDRSEWHWRLLYCGRIDDRKGIDLAVEAMARLSENATLTVLGGGDVSHLEDLLSLTRRLDLERRVTFVRRPRNELPRAYSEADVTLFPVRWEEPFGLVPLESMAMGTPVVASGGGGSGEYLADGENSLIFDLGAGADALARSVEHLAEDAGLRTRLSHAGVSTSSRFRAEDFDRAVERSLGQALGLTRRRQPGES